MPSLRVAALVSTGLLCACATVGAAAKYKPRGAPVPYEGFFATLDSGLRVVSYQVKSVDRFAVTFSYGAGAADDPPGKEGLAHLVEHLAFRARMADGTRIWDRVVAAGYRFNATTDYDTTDYFEVGKPADLDAALGVEVARLRDPLCGLTEADFKVEREVVLAEYRERFESDPDGAERQWVLEAAFPDGHPYGRPIGGTPASLRAITLDDARAFVKKHYAPANVIAVVISSRPPRDAAVAVANALGDLRYAARVDVSKPVPGLPPVPGELPELFRRSAPVRQPVVWVAWAVAGSVAKRDAQARGAVAALEQAFWYRAVRELGRADHLIERAEAAYFPFAGAGLVVMRVEIMDEREAERIAELARTAALDVRAEVGVAEGMGGLPPRERVNTALGVRERLLVESYLDLESIDGPRVARFLRDVNQPDYLAGWQKMIAAQLSYDVSPYAAEFLKRERSVAMLVVPDRNALARDVLEGAGPAGAHERDAGDDWDPPSREAVRTAAAPPGLDRAEVRVLPNGLTVRVAQRGALPIAEVRLVISTAAQGSPSVPVGLPWLALGTNYARFAAEELDRVGGTSWVDVGSEYLVRGNRGSAANLDVLLEGTADWARDQTSRWFDYTHDAFVRRVARLEHDPVTVAGEEFQARLFPNHPYGAAPDAKALEEVSSSDADRWLDREIRPERATLLVASDQRPSPELWAAIESHFGGWRRGSAARTPTPAPPPLDGRKVVVVDRPGASQAVVLCGMRLPRAADRDEAATEATVWLTRNRLFRALRFQEGVTYGASVGVLDREQAAAFWVAATVDRAAAARSVAAMLAAPTELAAKPVSLPDAGRARWSVARAYGFAFDTVDEATHAMADGVLRGLPPDHWERQQESIVSLSPERIQAAAATMSPGKEVVVLLGDAGVLEPQLRQAGFAPEVLRPGR